MVESPLPERNTTTMMPSRAANLSDVRRFCRKAPRLTPK